MERIVTKNNTLMEQRIMWTNSLVFKCNSERQSVQFLMVN